MANQTCEKLSPSEFQQLQDFAACEYILNANLTLYIEKHSL